MKVFRGSQIRIDCKAYVEPKWNISGYMPSYVRIFRHKNGDYTSQLHILTIFEENKMVYTCSQEEEVTLTIKGKI